MKSHNGKRKLSLLWAPHDSHHKSALRNWQFVIHHFIPLIKILLFVFLPLPLIPLIPSSTSTNPWPPQSPHCCPSPRVLFFFFCLILPPSTPFAIFLLLTLLPWGPWTSPSQSKAPYWRKGQFHLPAIYFPRLKPLPHFTDLGLYALGPGQGLVLTGNASPVPASQCVRSAAYQLECSVSQTSLGSDSNGHYSWPCGPRRGQRVTTA